VIAFVLTVTTCFLLVSAGFPLVLDFFRLWAPQVVVDTIASMSFLTHFQSIVKGVIDLRDLVYYLLMIGFWLFCNAVILDLKKSD